MKNPLKKMFGEGGPTPGSRLEGKVALVTGGTNGIGLATAAAFSAEGAKVMISARDAARGQAAAQKLGDDTHEVAFFPCDVADAGAVQALFEEIDKRFGRLDVALNNAGMMHTNRRCHEMSEEDWRAVVEVNLTGVWRCMKHEIPMMQRAGAGAIVNMGSRWSHGARPKMSGYTATKHAIIGLTRTAALECIGDGIRVNAISPGIIETDMTSGIPRDTIPGRVPAARMGSPEEIARTIVWMCSDEASYLVGETLRVDGGMAAE
jgi:NAD(P)-dependent dehydrogenase (short-subunit alcohol dehydrogenase family)